MHISNHFTSIEGGIESKETYQNHTHYFNQIGSHSERLKNLHFVYALMIRALNLVHEQLIDNDFHTGVCSERDAKTSLLVTEILTNTIGECAIDQTFNETLLF